MTHVMRKPTFCICENKDADQLHGNLEADQRLCFRYLDSTIPLLSKSEISSLLPSFVAVQPGLCRTRLETMVSWFSHVVAHMKDSDQTTTWISTFLCRHRASFLIMRLRVDEKHFWPPDFLKKYNSLFCLACTHIIKTICHNYKIYPQIFLLMFSMAMEK